MINNDWDPFIQEELKKDYFINLMKFVKYEYQNGICYPPYNLIANAFRMTSYKDTKVVILGQDPYHGKGEAMGLAFSVPRGIKLPPSLQNIFKELENDLHIKTPNCGDLSKWAKEGVLLLNTTLSVRENTPLSHYGKGWEIFTDEVIKRLNEKDTPIVFILWGSNARKKKSIITNPIHLIIESAHPSPLSAYNGFFGSKPFSRTNEFLIKNNIEPIDFSL